MSPVDAELYEQGFLQGHEIVVRDHVKDRVSARIAGGSESLVILDKRWIGYLAEQFGVYARAVL